ncbi:MAG: hypothetical protein ACREPR_13540 [Brasilonema sp.]
MDITSILEFIRKYATPDLLNLIARKPEVQFGTPARPFLLANYLPVVQKDTNYIVEDIMRVVGEMIANDSSPLSPPQIKKQAKGLSMAVALSHIDIADQYDGSELKTLGQMLNGSDSSIAEAKIRDWLTNNLRLSLEAKTELQRSQAIALGQVTVTPMDGAPFTVDFPSDPGNRVTVPSGTIAAPTGFYSQTTNPIIQYLVSGRISLQNQGYEPRALIGSSKIAGVISQNPMVLAAGGSIIINSSGNLQQTITQVSDAQLNAQLLANGLPPFTRYDRRYRTQTGTSRYFPENYLVLIGATGRDTEIIDYTDERDLKRQLIGDTLGYVGEGICDGQTQPGAVITVKTSELKPVGVYGEAYTNRFPLLLDYNAIRAWQILDPTP